MSALFAETLRGLRAGSGLSRLPVLEEAMPNAGIVGFTTYLRKNFTAIAPRDGGGTVVKVTIPRQE